MRTAVLAIAVLAVCASGRAAEKKPPSSGPSLKSSLDAVDQKWMDAAAKGDGKAIAALYTSDAQLLPPDSEPVAQPAIGTYFQGMLDAGVKAVKLQTLEAEGHGDSANAVGVYQVLGAEGKVLDKGKFIVLYKHDKDGWKLHRDMWNTSMPAAAPAKP